MITERFLLQHSSLNGKANRFKDRNGFTLLEVLIAISILVIISSLIYTSYAATIETTELNRKRAEDYHTARLILSKISDEIASVTFGRNMDKKENNTENEDEEEYSYFRFIGEDGEDNGFPNDSLLFTASISRWLDKDARETEVCEIEYRLGGINMGGGNTLLKTEHSIYVDEGVETIPFELGDIQGIDFKYFKEDGTEADEWNSDNEEDLKLPKAVKITIVIGDEERGMKEFFTIAKVNIDT